MYWPLMEDAITLKDRLKMASFVLTSSKLTNGPKVREFEEAWSRWLGIQHSLFVSSGSTANTLLVASMKELYGLKDGDKVLVPACTWTTNISPLIQSGLQPIFADINLRNYSFDIDELDYVRSQHPDIKAIFATHLVGLSSDLEEVRYKMTDELDHQKNKNGIHRPLIIEDICESHGVRDRDDNKRGTRCQFRGVSSVGATFSFYFGHHMTTIEGGMVSTCHSDLYELMRMKRSHGMAREASPELFKKYSEENPQCDPAFLFMTDGYNLRNHELCAVLGLSQLKRLDKNIEIRRKNYAQFQRNIFKLKDKFYPPEWQVGNSSFCFPIIPKGIAVTQTLKNIFKEEGIEYRPIISGNILRHPAFKKYSICTQKELPNVCILHKHGLYVGNSQFVDSKKVDKLNEILESV